MLVINFMKVGLWDYVDKGKVQNLIGVLPFLKLNVNFHLVKMLHMI